MAEQNPLKPLFKDIANAIREKDGTTGLIPYASDFPARIRAIPSGSLPSGVYTVDLDVNDADGGVVSGGGVASNGMTVTVKVDISDGYMFDGWEENGEIISTEELYTFDVTADRHLVANTYIPTYVPGVDWWETTLPASANWKSVVYGNGLFVAVAYSSNKVAYSEDGITWNLSTLPYTANWYSIAYGAKKFVAVDFTNGKISYSTDGISWETTTLPVSANWYSIAYGNKTFVTPGFTGGKSAYSNEQGPA